jgi:glycosyltransferase involved in cell wall biosynthesis
VERSEAHIGRPLLVLRLIARMNMGGPAHHVSILSTGLPADRYRTLLVTGRVGPGEQELATDARPLRLDDLGPELRPRADLVTLGRLVRLMRRHRPDIVHTHTAKAGLVGRLAARIALGRRPLVVHTYHGHVLEGYFGRGRTLLYRALETAMGLLSDALVAVSEATVDDLVRLRVAPAPKFRVIRLGLHLESFTSLSERERAAERERLAVGPDDVVAVFMGRLVPIKRVDLLIDAVAAARARGAPVVLVVVGGGECEHALRARASDAQIADAVRFAGYRSDIERVLAAADLAVLSSANEGTPVALIEAAAAGLPLVATDVGGVSDVVVSGTGELVPFGDAGALGAAIAALAADPERRREAGAAARRHVLARYGAARLVQEIDALYRDLLEGRARRS